jgi:hypothetical protein
MDKARKKLVANGLEILKKARPSLKSIALFDFYYSTNLPFAPHSIAVTRALKQMVIAAYRACEKTATPTETINDRSMIKEYVDEAFSETAPPKENNKKKMPKTETKVKVPKASKKVIEKKKPITKKPATKIGKKVAAKAINKDKKKKSVR